MSEEQAKPILMNKIVETSVPDEVVEEEGTYDLWVVDIDADKDGKELESPQDIDIRGLGDERMIRALFEVTKNSSIPMVKAIMGSVTRYETTGFELVRTPVTHLEFDDEEIGGIIKFNCKIQQLKNILFHRRTNFIHVLGTLD